MSYVDSNLMAGEHVMHRSKLHWAVFLWPSIWFAISVWCFNQGPKSAPGGSFLLVFITIPTAIGALVRKRTSEFAITNRRVLVKTGFIRRQSMETLLSKIEGVQVSQGILGRILDFGTIVIGGTGGSKSPFSHIQSPLEFRRRVQEQIVQSDTLSYFRHS